MTKNPTTAEKVIAQLTDWQKVGIAKRHEWIKMAHPKQIIFPGKWEVFFACAGRNFGKTRMGAEEAWWRAFQGQRVAAVAPTNNDIWRVLFEGDSGVLRCVPPEVLHGGSIELGYHTTKSEIHFKSGGVIQGYSAESPERLRGPQFHVAWCDELAAWKNAEKAWEQLELCVRLGNNPQLIVTTTPKPTPLVRMLYHRADGMDYETGEPIVNQDGTPFLTTVHRVTASSYDNTKSSEKFISRLKKMEHTRRGRQEIHAELLADIDGALWTTDMIDKARSNMLPREDFARIVVSVDPAMTMTNKSDQTGIVVVGMGHDGTCYVLEDRSGKYTPQSWGSLAVQLFQKWQADCILCESTQGGDLVGGVILAVNKYVNVKDVRSRKGKWIRAEPVAALYERDPPLVKHCGIFKELEDQMTHFTKDDIKYMKNDRVDALVYAVDELALREQHTPATWGRLNIFGR